VIVEFDTADSFGVRSEKGYGRRQVIFGTVIGFVAIFAFIFFTATPPLNLSLAFRVLVAAMPAAAYAAYAWFRGQATIAEGNWMHLKDGCLSWRDGHAKYNINLSDVAKVRPDSRSTSSHLKLKSGKTITIPMSNGVKQQLYQRLQEMMPHLFD
jgi:hypothetical protein